FNSVKLVNYYVNKDNSYEIYEEKRMNVRLGEGLNFAGHLRKKSVQQTINSLKFFRDIINFQSIKDVLPVATSAVREATNRQDFLKEVYQETGFQFRVLSGKEESLYSYLGALKSTCIPTALFFDLGGGSLEMVYAENFKIKKFISLPLGALRLSLSYGRMDGIFSRERYDKMKQYILKSLPDKKEFGISPKAKLVGVGGTLRAIVRYYYNQELRNFELGKKVLKCRLDYESIEKIHRKFYNMTPKEITRISDIGKNRANTITAGSCVIDMIMMKLGFGKIVASASGLRDGILSSFLECPNLYSTGRNNKNSNNDNFDLNQIQNPYLSTGGRRRLKKSSNP
ncbi:MAG TPA: hypothetical protein VFJ51_06305, partial [Nitrososphaeraceae archaeon]|nr:hypothetical protein [Nitrososphaeraceae archaeon]